MSIILIAIKLVEHLCTGLRVRKIGDLSPVSLILVPLFLLLTACGSPADDELSKYIYDVNARPAKPIDPIPGFVPIEKFVYPENDTRRSPFKHKTVEKVDALAPNLKRPKQPLELFPLDALKFVGVLKEGPVIWGLVSQPGGTVSKVRVGDYMGKDFGKIISITEQSIQIEETLQVEGNWEKRVTTFNLNTGQ